MLESMRRRYEAMAELAAPAGREAPLRDWLRAELEGAGARTEVDAVGNLCAVKGDGGQVVLVGLDEPTFLATGGGPEGQGAAPSGTSLKNEALHGRLVRCGPRSAVLRVRKDELTLDPLGAPLDAGDAAVFAAPRIAEGGTLRGPDAGKRALLCGILEAAADARGATVIALSRSGFSPSGGADLLLANRRARGVALEVVDEDDGSEIGSGPVLLVGGYAAPPRLFELRREGVGCTVRPASRPLAARLQPAGIDGIGIALTARYLGSDQERIAYQDATAMAGLLREVLASS